MKSSDNSLDQFCIITDIQGKILSSSNSFQKYFKDHFNKNQFPFFHDFISGNEKEKYLHLKNLFLQYYETSKTFDLDFDVQKKHRLHFLCKMTALLDENGIIKNICFTGSNINSANLSKTPFSIPENSSLSLSTSPAPDLEKSLEYFYSLTENIPAIFYEYIFRKDGSHGFKYISPSIKKIFGMSAKEYIHYVNQQQAGNMEILTLKSIHSRDTNEPFHFEGHINVPDKGTMWYTAHSSFSYMTDDGEKIFAGIIIDITERKKTQDVLIENAARFRDIAQSVPCVIYQWYENNDGSYGFSYMSPKLKEYFNIDPQDMTSFEHMIHPDDMEIWNKSIEEGRKNIKPWQYEGRFLYPDGNIKWWQGKSELPVKTEKGNLYNGILIDITEMVITRHELIRSNERYYYAAKATSEGIWDCDYIGKKIYRSDNFLNIFGYKHSITEFENVSERIHPDDRKAVLESLEKAIANNADRWEAEYQLRCENKSYKIVSNKAYLVRDENKKLLRIIGAIRDLSEQRTLEKKLNEEENQKKQEIIQAIIEAQEKERKELSYELHDNINQVLATCTLLLDLAKKNPALSAPYIEKCSENILQIINEIRDISRNLTTFTLDNLGLVPAIKDISEKINETGKIYITFKSSKTHDEKLIPADIKLNVFRIIQEEINNVIKHANASELKITLAFNTKKLRLELNDNGKGFELQKVKKGLGLQNIQSRVDYFHGKINIETAPGKGCIISIEFPY